MSGFFTEEKAFDAEGINPYAYTKIYFGNLPQNSEPDGH